MNQPTSDGGKMVFNEADRIVIGTPCYGGNVKQEFLTSLLDSQLHITIPVRTDDGSTKYEPLIASMLFLDKESHIDRARNKISNKFLATKYNWLLFIDSDIVFPKEAIARLWQHGMNGNSCVAAPYALKGVVPQFAINAVTGERPNEIGLVPVYHAGTGFLLINRTVFDALAYEGLAEEYNLGSNDPDRSTMKTHRAFFKSGVRTVEKAGKLWLSEDYMFCHEWRSIGGKVMVDARVLLEHIGDLKYPAAPAEVFAAAKEFRRIKHPDCPEQLI